LIEARGARQLVFSWVLPVLRGMFGFAIDLATAQDEEAA
jgi:hypothetical protein